MQAGQPLLVGGQSGGSTEQLIEGSVEGDQRILGVLGGHRRETLHLRTDKIVKDGLVCDCSQIRTSDLTGVSFVEMLYGVRWRRDGDPRPLPD